MSNNIIHRQPNLNTLQMALLPDDIPTYRLYGPKSVEVMLHAIKYLTECWIFTSVSIQFTSVQFFIVPLVETRLDAEQ